MKKGRDTFTFQLKDPEQARHVIDEWLRGYDFHSLERKGEPCYMYINTEIAATGCFKYQIQDRQLKIQVWQPMPMKDASIYKSNFISGEYRALLQQLFDALAEVSTNPEPEIVYASREKIDATHSFDNPIVKTKLTSRESILGLVCILGALVMAGSIAAILVSGASVWNAASLLISLICALCSLKAEPQGLAMTTIIFDVLAFILWLIAI